MAKYTPMMEQYLEIKENYKDCLLFFRLGDFYELFFEDAIKASKELEITLTGKDCGQEDRAPMCGVPFHSAEGYIAKLIEKGYKVAICEQVEDPKQTKTLVKREVIRIVTPGTVLDTNVLEEEKNNFIMCLFGGKAGYGISVCDVTTGEFLTLEFSADEGSKVIDEIAKYNPAEIICNEDFDLSEQIYRVFDKRLNVYFQGAFDYQNASIRLCNHFKTLNLNGFGLEECFAAVCASGALLEYLFETQKNNLYHISTIKKCSSEQYMILDLSSRRNLELTQTLREKSKKGSLLWVLDKTKTAMGARLLRKWIEQPLINVKEIQKRLDTVERFKDDVLNREELKELLNTIYDMERIMGKVVYGTANARDLNALKASLIHLPAIKQLLREFSCEYINEIYERFDTLFDIAELIDTSIVNDAPFSVREGGLIKDGFNEELDKLRLAKREGSTWLMELENEEKENTGIKNLKIRYNKVFGYYIEVTKSYLELVPENYIRKQTLTNCERFITPRLKEIEDTILGADEKITTLEYEIFNEIRRKVSENVIRIQKTATDISLIDVFAAFGEIADKYDYIKPDINDNGKIDIKNGRHPVVEKTNREAFIPNDVLLDTGENRLNIITGPNMAGKSTYMRQTALLVLMAQLGSFIPAEKAEIGICDRIFTRVGASDDLATGQSTFMIEMTEVANILNNATKKSLLILDEIGRGTSTFDGLSIAWAVLEYIADENIIGARTLFATHYRELTELEGKVDGVKNYSVSVKEDGENIIFLRKIVRGGTDRSYGIHVAKLAGVPEAVLKRSNEILDALGEYEKSGEAVSDGKYTAVKRERDVILINEIEEEIKKLDVNNISPFEALKVLFGLKEKIKAIPQK